MDTWPATVWVGASTQQEICDAICLLDLMLPGSIWRYIKEGLSVTDDLTIDRYADLSDFPFSDYFRDPLAFAGAISYWTDVVRSVSGYDTGWQPVPRPLDTEEDMKSGLALWLRQQDHRKQLVLHVTSVAGVEAELLELNGPMSKQQIAELSEIAGQPPTDQQVTGISAREAEEQARSGFQPFMAWVEPAEAWNGEQMVDCERLVINAAISSDVEPRVREALALFVTPGRATDQIVTP